jgi:hypothetical protein
METHRERGGRLGKSIPGEEAMRTNGLIRYRGDELHGVGFWWNNIYMIGDFADWDDPEWHARQAEEARQDAVQREAYARTREKARTKRAATRAWVKQLAYIMAEVRRREMQLASWEDDA